MVTVRTTTTGFLGGGGDDLAAAAGIVADGARSLASAWSVQIPPNISVSVSGNVATISSDVGPAYPNEVAGVRHPVWGTEEEELRAIAKGLGHGRGWPWVRNQHRPFLAPAADSRADAAMQRYAQKVDKLARAAGFE